MAVIYLFHNKNTLPSVSLKCECMRMNPVPSLPNLPGSVPVQGNWKSTKPCSNKCKHDRTLEVGFRSSIRPVKKKGTLLHMYTFNSSLKRTVRFHTVAGHNTKLIWSGDRSDGSQAANKLIFTFCNYNCY